MSFLFLFRLIPLVGIAMRTRRAVFFVGLFFAAMWMLGVAPMTFGIPTACGAAYWSLCVHDDVQFKTKFLKFFLSVILPLLCMLSFVVHPVGGRAAVYSLYWLIPIVSYGVQFFRARSLFLTSLSGAFITHAVGSVMWLYFVPTIPSKWIVLVPIVAVERLMVAAAGVVVFAFFKPLFYTEKNKSIISSIFVRANS